jgi:hypothetical protein
VGKQDQVQATDERNQSQKIRDMALEGQTNGAIAKALGIRYQTVWRTLNRPFQGVVPQEALVKAGIRTTEEPLVELEPEDEDTAGDGI